MSINPINIIRNRRERQLQEALEQFSIIEQQIRVETINYLSENGMLKFGVN